MAPEDPKALPQKSGGSPLSTEVNQGHRTPFSFDERRMTFTEHLGELRNRIIYSAVAVVIAFMVCYGFSNQLFYVIAAPLSGLAESDLVEFVSGDGTNAGASEAPAPANPAAEGTPLAGAAAKWVTLSPLEGFLVQFKLAGYFSLLLALPIILYHLCAFVFPGLTGSERKVVQILVGGCSLLGSLGVVVAYFGVFPLVLPYLIQWTPAGVEVQLRMSETISVILLGLVGFAIAFQFPMGVLVLVYMGLLTPQMLREYR